MNEHASISKACGEGKDEHSSISKARGEGKDEYVNKHLGYRWCLHKKITQGEVMDPVIAWLKVNPKKRHFTATSLVSKALQESFPCPK